ncbi:MAG TPA: HlyD family efflux transporter periplasmic adaptor subunit [Clostridia bacterium]|nr:HlyD family efflux transporter periplasmic adaptor subunit [Clostridia bacterium]
MKKNNFKVNKKRVAILILVVLILGATIYAALNQSVNGAGEKYYLKAYEVKEQELSAIVFTSGQVASTLEQNLTFNQSGKITTINFEIGDSVQKGEIIAALDQEDLLSQIRSSALQVEINEKNIQKLRMSGVINYEGAYKNAKLNYEKALNIFENNKKLYESGVISTSEFNQFKNALALAENDYQSTKKKYEGYGNGIDLEIAKLQLEESKAQLLDLENKLEDMILEAPFDGVITSSNLKQGEFVMSNTQGVVVETIDNLMIETEISQYDVDSINIGQIVEISRNGEDIIYEGKVSKINPTAVVSQQSSIVPVEIDIISENHYKPNYTVNVEIETDSNENAKVIPYEALIRDVENNHIIFKYSEGKVEKIIIDRGINGPLRTEIISDAVSVGDTILLDPPLELEDGDAVEIIETVE